MGTREWSDGTARSWSSSEDQRVVRAKVRMEKDRARRELDRARKAVVWVWTEDDRIEVQ